jgi:uncharacterized protein (DUF488 family)
MAPLCYTQGHVIVHTIGHSTLGLDEFVALLDAHGVGRIADVRRFPASRRHPHFARGALADALVRAGVGYTWLPALGGRRRSVPDSPHVAWRSPGFRAYADHMGSAEFAAGLKALVALAEERPTAVMCAEAVPWRCHRQLIADALVARGVSVRHILGPEPAREHRLTPGARLVGERLVYDRSRAPSRPRSDRP